MKTFSANASANASAQAGKQASKLSAAVAKQQSTSQRCLSAAAAKDGAVTATAGSRRAVLLSTIAAGSAALMGAVPLPASASFIGESITGAWKGTQRNNSAKIIAPIKVAQLRLQEAGEMLQKTEAAGAGGEAITDVLRAVRASSLNCYVFEALPDDSNETKASLFTQQFVQSADPCTFRIAVKNVTGLSSDETRKEGQDLVASVIRSYSLLDDYLDRARQGGSTLSEAAKQLDATAEGLRQLEGFVKKVLGV